MLIKSKKKPTLNTEVNLKILIKLIPESVYICLICKKKGCENIKHRWRTELKTKIKYKGLKKPKRYSLQIKYIVEKLGKLMNMDKKCIKSSLLMYEKMISKSLIHFQKSPFTYAGALIYINGIIDKDKRSIRQIAQNLGINENSISSTVRKIMINKGITRGYRIL